MTIIENHPAPAVQIPQPNWIMILFLAYSHILAIVGLSYIQVCQWQTLVWSFLLSFWSGIGVTGGAHRLWAHRSYKAHWTIRTFLMLMYSISNQGSIYHWVRDHRVHHKFSETDADPHNVRYSFLDFLILINERCFDILGSTWIFLFTYGMAFNQKRS